jgi:two-component system sensor histidine kinase KdpD
LAEVEVAESTAGDEESLRLARETLSQPGKVMAGGPQATADSTASPGRWIRVVAPVKRDGSRGGRVGSVPIVAGNSRLGSLVVVQPEGVAPFSHVDDRLLSAVASQLGMTLHRLALQTEANEIEVLRRTDELRSALLNAVSHDLRTPLASIIASAGSLLQTDVSWSDAEKAQFARTVLEESLRLDRLVSNLLDLSRIEAGNIRPEKAWYDLGSLCNEVVGRLRGVTAGHPIEVEVPDNLPPLYFDYVHIDQVLSNLIENAAHFTPEGAGISIAVGAAGDEVQVSVVDGGPGVSPSETERIFKPFYRAPDSRLPGTGLGLAVARGLVEANGGRIWAENGPGGGARFTFTLPVTERPAAAA